MNSHRALSPQIRSLPRASRAQFSLLGGRTTRPSPLRRTDNPALDAHFQLWSPTLLDRLQPALTRIHE